MLDDPVCFITVWCLRLTKASQEFLKYFASWDDMLLKAAGFAAIPVGIAVKSLIAELLAGQLAILVSFFFSYGR